MPYGKADLQIHTAVGDGMAEIPELLEYVEVYTDLDVIAITDHDSLDGAEQAYNAWARGRYSFEVIVGTEVTTLAGHVLALWLQRPVPSFRPLAQTLAAIHAQGGVVVVPHPFCWLTRSIGERALRRIQLMQQDGVYFDGIEVINGSPGGQIGRQKAQRLNRWRYHLAETGSSDAHFLRAIGSAYTIFSGKTAEDLRSALLTRQTSAEYSGHPPLTQIGLQQVFRQQVRGLLVTPRNTIGRSLHRLIQRTRT